MGKLKIKKSDVWIDMTPMSDVMVLLLTFFMLTSTFVKNEPVKVNAPKSVSEIDIPEQNLLTIHVDGAGQVFMTTTDQNAQLRILDAMLENERYSKYASGITPAMKQKFKIDPMWGVSMSKMKSYLEALDENKSELIKTAGGIPTDSINGAESEFQLWVKAAKDVYKEINGGDSEKKMKLAIKADSDAPYGNIKKVINELQDIDESRYSLITQLKTGKEE